MRVIHNAKLYSCLCQIVSYYNANIQWRTIIVCHQQTTDNHVRSVPHSTQLT